MKELEMHGIFHGLATLASPSEAKRTSYAGCSGMPMPTPLILNGSIN